MTGSVKDTSQQDNNTEGVSQEEFVAALKKMGGDVVKLAAKAALVYGALVGCGLLLGGVVGGGLATYYSLSTFGFLGALGLGGLVGGAGGFLGSKMVVGGMIEDLGLKHGLDLADMGMRELMGLVKKAKSSSPIIRKPLEAIGGLASSARSGIGFLRKHFGEKAEKPATPATTPVAANDVKPAEPQKLKA